METGPSAVMIMKAQLRIRSGSSAAASMNAWTKKVIFPTRMNLQLLAEANGADDAVARATARTLVTVQPQIQRRDSGNVLVLPPDAGYGAVEEPLENVM